MNICTNCQASNPADYSFCQFCGSPIVGFPNSPKVELMAVDKTEVVMSEQSAVGENVESAKPAMLVDSALANYASTPFEEKLSNEVEPEFPEFVELDPLNIDGNIDDLAISTLSNSDGNSDGNVTSQVLMEYPEYSPSYLQEIIYAAKTDVGEQRDLNEDDFIAIFQTMELDGKSQIRDRSFRGLFIVCDGMGGHEGGEVASKMAVNSIVDQFKPFWIDTLPGRKKLKEIILNAHQAIYEQNEAHNKSALERMGTTLAMMIVHNRRVAIAHVGDSRIYQVTSGGVEPKLEQLTRDHEVLNQLLDLGMSMEEVRARPDIHQLTQALGPNEVSSIDPEMKFLEIKASTLFLICSDGLSDHDLIEQNWRSHLLPILNQDMDLQTGLENLMRLGNTANGHDNLTAVLVLCLFN
ncbi:MAG: protein phosphatase 2C domain-containing protein [Pseudanabaenaceae cyanobacterium bins.39]|nr:protein phosphatase 2C domain-containing protein [Pseudanabaenaceae cyanobacterium bins.39]